MNVCQISVNNKYLLPAIIIFAFHLFSVLVSSVWVCFTLVCPPITTESPNVDKYFIVLIYFFLTDLGHLDS